MRLPVGGAGTTLARMRPIKDAIGTDVVPLRIGGHRLELVASVRIGEAMTLLGNRPRIKSIPRLSPVRTGAISEEATTARQQTHQSSLACAYDLG